MTLPIQGSGALALGVLFGALFGILLQKGRVACYDVIVNQFRLKDFTVLKVMLTAVIVGGVGVLALHAMGYAEYHIKPTNILGVVLGSAIFGVGMVLYGYCPGTGVAAIAQGSLHALVGALGMLVGGMLYAASFDWVQAHILTIGSYGKLRLPDITGIPSLAYFAVLSVAAVGLFRWLDKHKV